VKRVARELLCVGLAVEGVGPVAGVPGRVAPAATEEAEAARHSEGHGDAVVVEAVVLLVRVDPDNGEDDRENEQRHEHDPDGHLTHAPAVHRHTGAPQLPDAIGGLDVGGIVVGGVVCRWGRLGGGHHDRVDRSGVLRPPRCGPSAPTRDA
jgi:hypothetical protein